MNIQSCVNGIKRAFRTKKAKLMLLAALISPTTQGAGLLVPVGQVESLDMVNHHVKVTIQDGFAVTQVDQEFANPSSVNLDAHYRFPVPSEASVGQFTYWINGQSIHGEVVEKEKATKIYKQEKQQGRKVAVSEQQGFQHFDIKVANLMPGENAKVRLLYVQPIEMDHGIGRFVYPLEDGGTDEEQKAFWTMKQKVENQFHFSGTIRSSHPVDAVRMPNQPQANIQQVSPQEWSVALGQFSADLETAFNGNQGQLQTKQQTQQLDKDIVFYWRLQQGVPGGLDVIAYKEKPSSTGTVMMTLTPADDLQNIREGTDWTLVLDISGSMQGKFNTLLQGVKQGLTKFNPQDRVRVILFNNDAENLTNGYVQATPESLSRLMTKLESVQPAGGTNLMEGVRKALSGLDSDRTSAIWLVTDGVVTVGEHKQKKFLELLKKKDIRLFTFIMGNGANRPLLKGLSRASNGFAIEVSNSDDMVGQLEKAASKVGHEALHDIQIDFDGIKVKDIQPKTIGSLYRGQQLQIFGHYWKAGKGTLRVTAKRSGQKVSYEIPITLPETDKRFPELERLWAYSQIQHLMDEQEIYGHSADRKDAVVDLAKNYSLVTPYTSMLVLEEEQFAQYGIKRINNDRIQKEEAARSKRANQPIANHNQVQNHSNLSQSRSTLGGGSFGWVFLIGVAVFAFNVRRFSKLMS